MKKKKTIKGYKAFKKDMTCRGFKFEEGETYKTSRAECCINGFHFCENPLDTLNFYSVSDSQFHEVEGLGSIDTYGGDDSKKAATEIVIGKKLNLSEFIDASVEFLLTEAYYKSVNYSQSAQRGDYSKSAQSGNYSKSAQSGYYSKSAQSGNYSKSAQSGYYSQSAQSGDSSKSAQSGNFSKSAQSGHYSKSAQSGDYSQSAQSGNYSKSAQSGYYSKSAQSGDYSQSAQSGNFSKSAQSGYYSKSAQSCDYSQSAQSGDSSKSAQSGNFSKSAQSGHYSKSAQSGDYSQLEISSKTSVGANIGIGGKCKGKKGSWIVLAEWVYNEKVGRHIPVDVKAVKIDGKRIKEDTWYILKNGKFTVVSE